MSLGRTYAVALLGLTGSIVEVEADISSGLPKIVLVGLPDAALNEARERVRAAAANSGCSIAGHKITIALSPAALPKQGSGFDLAIAVASLVATGDIPADSAPGRARARRSAASGVRYPASGSGRCPGRDDRCHGTGRQRG